METFHASILFNIATNILSSAKKSIFSGAKYQEQKPQETQVICREQIETEAESELFAEILQANWFEMMSQQTWCKLSPSLIICFNSLIFFSLNSMLEILQMH